MCVSGGELTGATASKNGTRFQRFGLARPIRQPAGLGWYDGRLWRSPIRWVAMPQDANPKCPNSRGRVSYLFSVLPASCRQNGTMGHATVCRQDAGSTFGVTFRPPLNTYRVSDPA